MENKELWMNHRKIDEKGLIVPYQKERQYNLMECVSSLQNLLAHRQGQGFPAHYAWLKLSKDLHKGFEEITYKGYLVGRCPKGKIEDQKQVKEGTMNIDYKIIRIDNSNIKSLYPYLVLFQAKIESYLCSNCQDIHLFRIYKSSFEAIRMQFAIEVSNKIKFMQKYTNYSFQPHNFVSNRPHAHTPFIRLKYEDYEASEYYEASQEIIINLLRINCLAKDFDYECMRRQHYQQWMGLSQEEKDQFQSEFKLHELLVKTKYICKRCKEGIIWTTKIKVRCMYKLLKLTDLPPLGQNKKIYEKDQQFQAFVESMREKKQSVQKLTDKVHLSSKYRFDVDKLDKSMIREVDQYEEYKKYFNTFGRWHTNMEDYKCPMLVVVNVQIPKMKCTGCGLEKDGLIYQSYLVNFISTGIVKEVEKKAVKVLKGNRPAKTAAGNNKKLQKPQQQS